EAIDDLRVALRLLGEALHGRGVLDDAIFRNLAQEIDEELLVENGGAAPRDRVLDAAQVPEVEVHEVDDREERVAGGRSLDDAEQAAEELVRPVNEALVRLRDRVREERDRPLRILALGHVRRALGGLLERVLAVRVAELLQDEAPYERHEEEGDDPDRDRSEDVSAARADERDL